ncbi:hypothetical protein F9K96_05560 [Brucella anthropi]|uniref:hypothetical protein n=1 Tax=Brucella anthropi TaxID=529 RepID=UPI00124C3E2C|nr:hypothetical protein [Brucella anthropi]KAB2792605.1 hypothetical protein F9K96_05560 [Brucella anthropi]
MGITFKGVVNANRTGFKSMNIRLDTIESADVEDGFLVIRTKDIEPIYTLDEDKPCATYHPKTTRLYRLANWLRETFSGS